MITYQLERFRQVDLRRVIRALENSEKFIITCGSDRDIIFRNDRGIKLFDGTIIDGFNEYHLYLARRNPQDIDDTYLKYIDYQRHLPIYRSRVIDDFRGVIGLQPSTISFRKFGVNTIYDSLLPTTPLSIERIRINFRPWDKTRTAK